MNVVAIIQARLGSSRLPLKSLVTLNDKPLIDWVTNRVGAAREVNRVVVATPDTELDKPLRDHLKRRGREVIEGSENDVLDRFLLAARQTDADLVLRVCADNPFIWPEAIDRLVRFYRAGDYDYAYNHIPKGNAWPDGLGAEILARETLEKIASLADKPAQREHCLNYIWDTPSDFRVATFDPEENWLRRPEIKLDIDTPEDFRRLSLSAIRPDSDAREIIAAWDAASREKWELE